MSYLFLLSVYWAIDSFRCCCCFFSFPSFSFSLIPFILSHFGSISKNHLCLVHMFTDPLPLAKLFNLMVFFRFSSVYFRIELFRQVAHCFCMHACADCDCNKNTLIVYLFYEQLQNKTKKKYIHFVVQQKSKNEAKTSTSFRFIADVN